MNEMTPPQLPAPEEQKLLPAPDGHGEAHGGAHEAKPAKAPRAVFIGAGIVLLAAVLWGTWTHLQTRQRASDAQQAEADFKPVVRTAVAQRQDGPVMLTLPGTTLAYDQADLYARATGYIAERRVDIGSRVKKGDLLFRIAAPDLDAQLQQAAAQLAQTQAAVVQADAQVDSARASLYLANRTNFRTTTLANQGWETKQNADNTQTTLTNNGTAVETSLAGVKVAEANRQAQAAAVQRLEQLTGYEQVTAPFDGVITARNVDTGDLVTADAGSGAPAFTIQRDDVIRVQAYVPQSGAFGIADGVPVQVRVPELPDRKFDGSVTRSAIALDPASRTLLVQADVPNPDGALHPGSFIDVAFNIPRTHASVIVPAEAVLFDAEGLHVAVIGDDDKAHMVKVTIGRDFGTTVELITGLSGGERVALQPPANLADGQEVKPQDNNAGDQKKA